MIQINEIGFTIYAVTNIEKSRAFYEGVLGLKRSKEFADSEYWVEYDIGPGTFAIGCSPDWKPSEDGATVSFEVEDFDAAIEHLKSAGIEFKLEPQGFPTCSMAVVKDPDRNNVLIHKRKAK